MIDRPTKKRTKTMLLYHHADDVSHAGADTVASTVLAVTNGLRAVRAVLRWRIPIERLFDPYRPERHYMRGPGPAWRAKHLPGRTTN